MMISKARIKQIRGLERKKNRVAEGLFVAEGPKLVGELLAVVRPHYVAAEDEWLEEHKRELQGVPCDTVSLDELQRASLLQHPQQVLALFPIPQVEGNMSEIAERELTLALDGVQDPGNLGTIVRLADWFGISHIFCSPDSADIYNPKATQATMGALARVSVHYCELAQELCKTSAPIYGTFLDGQNIYHQELSSNGVIIMGNEGQGIRKETAACVSHRLFVPPFPTNRSTVESLNVAIATAIVCAEFRRKTPLSLGSKRRLPEQELSPWGKK
ncbi:MAG: RNA methyltransferase [Bacteroidaceae bacterium]|nr:RNA methyltransferase [Bacteroidaceae bacterium]